MTWDGPSLHQEPENGLPVDAVGSLWSTFAMIASGTPITGAAGGVSRLGDNQVESIKTPPVHPGAWIRRTSRIFVSTVE